MSGATDTTLGTVRRVDGGATPDRHPGAVRWPDERRPRPRKARRPVTATPDALRERLRPPPPVPASPDVATAPSLTPRAPGPAGWAVDPGAGVEDRRGQVRTEERPDGARRPRHRRDAVEANARLTGTTAALLFVLLAVEGLTILRLGSLLSVHVFVGMLLIPPVLLKIGSTTWRFARYYLGDPEYRRKGPPPPLLRLLGPVVVVLTLVVLFSGVALLLAPTGLRQGLLLLHKASFVVWLVVMAIHVLGHLLDTARLAPRDFYRRTRRQVQGAGARQWLVATSVAVGLLAGAVLLPTVGPWVAAGHR